MAGGTTIDQLEQRLRALLDGGPALLLGGEGVPVPPPCALALYTSGSTGRAKLVGLTRENLVSSATASLRHLGAEKGSTWSVKLPLHHIAGVQVVMRSIINDGTIVDSNADYTSIVPTQLVQALAGSPLLAELQQAKAVLVGGGHIDRALLSQAINHGINVVTTYGMSETSGGCVYDGVPLDDVDIDIEEERIRIRGPVVAHGYLNDAQATQEHFVNGWFVTNDRGHFEDDRLVIDGRIDDIIVSGGENISLVEVEERLRQHPHINDVICFAVPDSEWGELLVAAVVSEVGITLEEMRDFMGEKRFAAPRRMIRLNSLPRTGLGKPDRAELRKMAMQ